LPIADWERRIFNQQSAIPYVHRRTVEAFLTSVRRSGALHGVRTQDAFVRGVV